MKIELCAASQEAIQIASELKLDRIELCQNLDQGGLTPSAGMIKYAKDLGLETHVLIRPRAGGFHYSDEEMKVILNDVQFCKDFGVDGIVIGFLQPNFEIDLESIERINSVRGNLKLTFHRAFDDSIEWRRSLDKLIACGVDRLLTSGFASNVDIGLHNLIEMTSYSNRRIEIMPGGGVNVGNILKIKRDLDPESIHFSGTIKVLMDEESAFSETLLKADANRIAKMCDLIRG
jgi:copper homeostasis protein